MNVVAQRQSDPRNTPVRILVVGSDLLAGALSRALEAYGFVTRHVMHRERELGLGIAWRPNLVLIDARGIEVNCGLTLVRQLSGAGTRVCVIDAVNGEKRAASWTGAGASALIDRREPFERLFGTITRILRMDSLPQAGHRPSARWSVSTFAAPRPHGTCLESFSVLTDREQFVLAELMEGHCAEEIANTAVVSISTVRSQIKAVLQKLGVNSQLAAVALARRAGWSLDNAPRYSPERSNYSRVRAS